MVVFYWFVHRTITHLILFIRHADALARQQRSKSVINYAKEKRDEKRLKDIDAISRINSYANNSRRTVGMKGTKGGKVLGGKRTRKGGMKVEMGDGPPTAQDVVESLKEERAMEARVKRDRQEIVDSWRRNGYMNRMKKVRAKVKGEDDQLMEEIESVLSADLKGEEEEDRKLIGGGMEDPLELSGDEEEEEEGDAGGKVEAAAIVKEERSMEEEDEGDDNGDYSYWEALMDAAESAKTEEE